jgi:hypothetical protein
MMINALNLLAAGITKLEITTVIVLFVIIIVLVLVDVLLVAIIHKMNNNIKVRANLYAKSNHSIDSEVREVATAGTDAASYNFSFSARLNQANEITQLCYGRVKNELLTHNTVESVMDWEYESFVCDEGEIARISLRENYVAVCLALDTNSESLNGIAFENLADVENYSCVPVRIVMDTPQVLAEILSLVRGMCEEKSLTRGEEHHTDYREPKHTIEQLLMLGLIK